jgi:hypothetical protein
MVMDESRLRKALREIARIAGEASQDDGQDWSDDGAGAPDATDGWAACRIMALPDSAAGTTPASAVSGIDTVAWSPGRSLAW